MMQLGLALELELERNKMKLVLRRNEQMLGLERSELRLEQHIELELGLELERNELKLVVQIELELGLGLRSLAYSLLELKRVGIVVVVLVGKLVVVVVEVGSKLELAEDNILELEQRMLERMKGMLVQLERKQGMLALEQRIVAKLLASSMAMLVLVLNAHSCVV